MPACPSRPPSDPPPQAPPRTPPTSPAPPVCSPYVRLDGMGITSDALDLGEHRLASSPTVAEPAECCRLCSANESCAGFLVMPCSWCSPSNPFVCYMKGGTLERFHHADFFFYWLPESPSPPPPSPPPHIPGYHDPP
eukprot:4782508-Prymnesium_polylepis.1